MSSPWFERHRTTFKGPIIPFGALIDFMPIPKNLKEEPKFAPRSKPGVFFGYHLSAGGLFKGDFYVVDLEQFTGQEWPDMLNKVHPQRTKEVVRDKTKPIEYPLRALMERHRRTIGEVPMVYLDLLPSAPLELDGEDDDVEIIQPAQRIADQPDIPEPPPDTKVQEPSSGSSSMIPARDPTVDDPYQNKYGDAVPPRKVDPISGHKLPNKGSTRPAWHDDKLWTKLSHPARQAIAKQEEADEEQRQLWNTTHVALPSVANQRRIV